MEDNFDIENIMHGLSKTNVAPEEEVFENIPVFPRISRSKELTLLLVNRLKNYRIENNTVICNTEAVYIDEKYTYRYFDYRQENGRITTPIKYYRDRSGSRIPLRLIFYRSISAKMQLYQWVLR